MDTCLSPVPRPFVGFDTNPQKLLKEKKVTRKERKKEEGKKERRKEGKKERRKEGKKERRKDHRYQLYLR